MGFVVTLDKDLDRAVAVLAAQRGVSKAEIMDAAVREYLANHIVAGDKE